MFNTLRQASEALQDLATSLKDIRLVLRSSLVHAEQQEEHGRRISALEVGSATRSAEAEATLLKADALFKNARNAEERARDKSKKGNGGIEPQVEGEAEIRAAYSELYGVPPEDVELSGKTTLHSTEADLMRTEVETRRALRLRHKFG